MAKWNVTGSVPVFFTLRVDAQTKEEAEERAVELWPGLSDLCGNGATHGRLVGHTMDDLVLEAGDPEPEFDEPTPDDD